MNLKNIKQRIQNHQIKKKKKNPDDLTWVDKLHSHYKHGSINLKLAS